LIATACNSTGGFRVGLRAASERVSKADSARVRFDATMRTTTRIPLWPMPSASPGFTFSAAIRGDGEIVFPDRLHLNGTTSAGNGPGSRFEIIAIGDRAWIRQGDEKGWLSIPRGSSPLGLFVTDPEFTQRLLRSSAGRVSSRAEAGTVTYSYDVSTPGLGAVAGKTTAEVTVGSQDRLPRRLKVDSRGRVRAYGESDWETTQNVTFADYGIAASIDAPTDVVGNAPAPHGPSMLVYPFGSQISIGSVASGSSASASQSVTVSNGSVSISQHTSASSGSSPAR
jgi:hypothetical protein